MGKITAAMLEKVTSSLEAIGYVESGHSNNFLLLDKPSQMEIMHEVFIRTEKSSNANLAFRCSIMAVTGPFNIGDLEDMLIFLQKLVNKLPNDFEIHPKKSSPISYHTAKDILSELAGEGGALDLDLAQDRKVDDLLSIGKDFIVISYRSGVRSEEYDVEVSKSNLSPFFETIGTFTGKYEGSVLTWADTVLALYNAV